MTGTIGKLTLPNDFEKSFGETLRSTFFKGWDPAYLLSAEFSHDLNVHIVARMREAETVVTRWIGEVVDLAGKDVLELGCGTGSSTAPIAARAKHVVAIDVHADSMEAAQERLRLLALENVEFHLLPGNWAEDQDGLAKVAELAPSVDVVMMEAILEHLTLSERLNVLRLAWERLRPGGILVIYETPNRLSCFDWHSFALPFFDMLPDELAIAYAKKSPRPFFAIDGTDAVHSLYRLGRGVSFHEFDLAIGLDQLVVANDGFSPVLHSRRGMGNPHFERGLIAAFGQYASHLPNGFAKASIDLIIRKGEGKLAPHLLRGGESSDAVDAVTNDVPLRYKVADRALEVLQRALPTGIQASVRGVVSKIFA